ncbi:MAG: bile acid:sodium symporter family protein [Burkholderiaceae bacterium]|nr:bile acid:sodium symporter family protein [Sulfuritalea sp.]MCF8174373.1 bile acid:sodium symporter family protein [Burkholderiaceae bacterium]
MILDLLLPLALACIMFTLGIGLVPDDFLRLFAQPRAMAVGLVGQLVLVPALAWSLVLVLGLPAEMAIGVMILAACPGGVSSGLLTLLARGETALSISLTAISSVAAVVTLPWIVAAAMQHFSGQMLAMEIPVGRMVRGMFLLTTVPVVLGMSLRHLRPAFTRRIELAAGRVATSLFVLIVIATFVSQRAVLVEHLPSVGPAMLMLNLLAMSLGFGLAAVSGLQSRGRIAVAMESGLQNAALGIFVAASVLQAPALAVPSVVYALLMNFGAIGFVLLMRRRVAEPSQCGGG